MASYHDPIDDWPAGEDELSVGQPEAEGAEYYVDWIEDAIFQDGVEGKKWYYTVKWSGWRRNANTKEPLASFDSKEMPKRFWAALKLHFEPKKNERRKDHYVTPSALLTEWMGTAKTTRNNRIKSAQAKNNGKAAKKLPPPKPADLMNRADYSDHEPLAHAAPPKPKPKPAPKPKPSRADSDSPPPQKKVSFDKGKDRASEVTGGLKKKKLVSLDEDSSDTDDGRPMKKKKIAAQRKLSPSSPPVKRPAPRPNVNSTSTNGEMTSRERAELYKQKELERKRREKDALGAKQREGSGAPEGAGEPKKVVKKQHDWGLGSRPSGSRNGNGEVEPKVSNGYASMGFEDSYSSTSTINPALLASTSSVIPKKHRTTVNLLLGPPKTKPTLASLVTEAHKAQQPLGLADLTDLTEALPVTLAGGAQVQTIKDLLGKEGDVCFEQTLNVFQAAVALRGVIEAVRPGGRGGSVIQFCRVEASVKGEQSDRTKREGAFRKLAWWLEESCEGGSISVAYLLQSPYALILLPRSSRLCFELNVPSSLRDACRPYKESLIGALVLLPRPTLPMPVKTVDLALDFFLDRWNIDLDLINSLRQSSVSVAIFSPRSNPFNPTGSGSLRSIALLEDLLTGLADQQSIFHLPARIIPIPAANDPESAKRFLPEVVLVHNAEQLWALPNLPELRRRTGTKFFGFGTGKSLYVSDSKSSLFEFGTGRKIQLTLTPSVLLEEPGLVKKDLIPLLRLGADFSDLILHPSTIVYIDTVCNEDQAPFKNITYSALMMGCRTRSVPTGPFSISGTQPLNPSHDMELVNRNADLESELAEAHTFADVLKACKEYCSKDGSLDAGGGGRIELERAEEDALGMMRSNLRNTSLISKYRRFLVVGPTNSGSPDVEELRVGAENATIQELLIELKGRYP